MENGKLIVPHGLAVAVGDVRGELVCGRFVNRPYDVGASISAVSVGNA